MAQAQQGDKVTFNYVGTLDDGTIFDSTLESDCDPDECDDEECGTDDCGCGGHATGPMELTLGSGDFLPQVEEALVGMAPGEKKSVQIPAADAFGDYDEERVFSVPYSDLPDDLRPQEGDELVLTGEDEEELAVCVTAVTAEGVTFDANHPLAGEDLTFEIELVSIL